MRSVRLGREIDTALRKKGFLRELAGKHIHYYLIDHSEIVTHMSHGMMGSTINVDLIGKMARQLRLTKTQFLDLIDCRLSEKEYRQILQNYDEDV
jgi:hypothetical protein